MKKGFKIILALLTVVLLLGAMGCSGDSANSPSASPTGTAAAPTGGTETKDVKVGFIYIGPPGDGGWTYAHHQARAEMMANLGLKEEDCPYIESVPETQECEVAIEQLVDSGCNVIFTTSFGFMDYTLNMAEKYPDVVFMHCSGYKTADNMGNYFGRIYQARYLTGIAAGEATETNKIGYVAAMPIPEVIRGINAFTQGVRSVNPDATVTVIWTNTWYDPAKEKEAAESLLAAGCDVIAQHQDTYEPVKAAEAAGVFSTGYHSPMGQYAPNGYLTGPVWNFGPYYTEVVKSVQNGTWTPGSYWEGFKDGVVMLDTFGKSVTDATKQEIEAKKQEMTDGTFDVFWGPINDQSGAVKVPEGSKMTDEEMLSFDWFVEGVEGSIPAS